MVCLCTLQSGHMDGPLIPPHPRRGTGHEGYDPEEFYPTFNINGRRAQSLTYCPSLRNEAYSNELKELIWECLYKLPFYRPGIREVKRRIGRALVVTEGEEDSDGDE